MWPVQGSVFVDVAASRFGNRWFGLPGWLCATFRAAGTLVASSK